jgi:hypothetical protein
MTEIITFRPKREKRALQLAFGNLSEKLNELIERELARDDAGDWRVVLDRPRPAVSEDSYAQCLKPE